MTAPGGTGLRGCAEAERRSAALEAEAHRQLVELLPRYSIAPSKWNQSRGAAKVRGWPCGRGAAALVPRGSETQDG